MATGLVWSQVPLCVTDTAALLIPSRGTDTVALPIPLRHVTDTVALLIPSGVVKVFVEYKHRPNLIELLNKPTEATERHRFMYYGDSKFSLVKKPATCSREDLMTALRSGGVELIRVQSYGQKATCVIDTAVYSPRY